MAKKQAKKSEIVTVMFIDIVSYTKTTTDLSRDNLDRLHDVFDNISMNLFQEYGGKIIKKMGDAFLVVFRSATDAVLCGIELQRKFMNYNKKYKLSKPIQIRVALHTGEVIFRDGDIYGDTVNTAARVESVTKAGHIVFSETVYSAMNKNEISYVHLGLKKMKGLKRPLRLFKVKTKIDEIIEKEKKKKIFYRKIKRTIIKLVILGLIVMTVFFVVRYLLTNSSLI